MGDCSVTTKTNGHEVEGGHRVSTTSMALSKWGKRCSACHVPHWLGRLVEFPLVVRIPDKCRHDETLQPLPSPKLH